MSDLRAFVDRIEGDIAVLLVGEEGQKLVVPSRLLPPGTHEGCVLTLRFEINLEATEQARRDIEDLIDRLKRRDSI